MFLKNSFGKHQQSLYSQAKQTHWRNLVLFFWSTSLLYSCSKRIPKTGGNEWYCLSKCLLAGFLSEWKLQHHLLMVRICYSPQKLPWDMKITLFKPSPKLFRIRDRKCKSQHTFPSAVQQVCATLTNPVSVHCHPDVIVTGLTKGFHDKPESWSVISSLEEIEMPSLPYSARPTRLVFGTQHREWASVIDLDFPLLWNREANLFVVFPPT